MRVLPILLAAVCAVSAWGETPALESTLADQADVSLTAYNGGLALVRDVRNLTLPPGEARLTFMDVAALIQPETVSLRSLTQPGSVAVIEQNYEYDLIAPSKLMEKYIGRDLKLVNFSKEIAFTEVPAKLLSTNEGSVFQVGNDIYLGHTGYVALPEIPENLMAKPSLVWLVGSETAEQQVEVTYLTGGIAWKADYVVNLDRSDTKLDIEGWVTMDNQSGATFTNAQLKLVAGDVNRVPVPCKEEELAYEYDAVLFATHDGIKPQEEVFGEYHLYTMPRRTTIKQNQSKQLALLEGRDIACVKKYEYRGQAEFYSQPMPPMPDQHPDVFIEFENEEDNHLGIPLPAGVMRIYQADTEGMTQFAGEDRIEHTPKDETVRLRMGQAFDLVAERVQKDYRIVASDVYECAYEIAVRNHKETDVVVDVVEPMPNDWKILEKSQEFVKKDAQTAVFRLAVPKDGTVTLTYRVRVKY